MQDCQWVGTPLYSGEEECNPDWWHSHAGLTIFGICQLPFLFPFKAVVNIFNGILVAPVVNPFKSHYSQTMKPGICDTMFDSP